MNTEEAIAFTQKMKAGKQKQVLVSKSHVTYKDLKFVKCDCSQCVALRKAIKNNPHSAIKVGKNNVIVVEKFAVEDPSPERVGTE